MSSVSGLSNSQLGYDVGIAVARKTLDTQRAQGDAALKLLEGAAELSQQSSERTTAQPVIRPEPHKGNLVDVIA